MDLTKIFQSYAEHQVARILTQMDRDPQSPTFGCFDRNYWHFDTPHLITPPCFVI